MYIEDGNQQLIIDQRETRVFTFRIKNTFFMRQYIFNYLFRVTPTTIYIHLPNIGTALDGNIDLIFSYICIYIRH